jgi:hypothetical protein
VKDLVDHGKDEGSLEFVNDGEEYRSYEDDEEDLEGDLKGRKSRTGAVGKNGDYFAFRFFPTSSLNCAARATSWPAIFFLIRSMRASATSG